MMMLAISDQLAGHLADLPWRLAQHMGVAVAAMAVGAALALPMSLLAVRVSPLRMVLLLSASIILTIPSLALLAFSVPYLGIGFAPTFLALLLYSLLPIVRNTITGMEGVDPNLIEAGTGLGMTRWQLIRRVQLPLSLPMILAGLRTANVWVVSTATLSTPVGYESLGNYIFTGLQRRDWTGLWVGIIATSVLALGLDALIGLMETGVRRRSKPRLVIGLFGALAVVGVSVYPIVDARLLRSGPPPVRIGAKTFTEQYILADLIETQLQAAGREARSLESLGSSIVFDALVEDEIDVYVDYSGTIWANAMGRSDQASAQEVLDAVTDWVREEHGVVCLGSLGFENAYALAMPRAAAEQLGIETIDDLARHADELSMGGDYEFFDRPEWDAVVDAYGLEMGREVSMDSTLMYEAVRTGDVDVISAFSSDGRIAAYDLLVLRDTRNALPPYDAILLVRPELLEDRRAEQALLELIGAIDDDAMRSANKVVDVDRDSVAAAVDYLRAVMRGEDDAR
jgi:osmoprotectant transport system permease protein